MDKLDSMMKEYRRLGKECQRLGNEYRRYGKMIACYKRKEKKRVWKLEIEDQTQRIITDYFTLE